MVTTSSNESHIDTSKRVVEAATSGLEDTVKIYTNSSNNAQRCPRLICGRQNLQSIFILLQIQSHDKHFATAFTNNNNSIAITTFKQLDTGWRSQSFKQLATKWRSSRFKSLPLRKQD